MILNQKCNTYHNNQWLEMAKHNLKMTKVVKKSKMKVSFVNSHDIKTNSHVTKPCPSCEIQKPLISGSYE